MTTVLSQTTTIPPDLRLGLRDYWYPIATSTEVSTRPVAFKRLGEQLVVWRDASSAAHVFVDRCAHRGALLSLGDVIEGHLQCRYHGLQYDGTGQCRLVPVELKQDGPQAQRIRAQAYPTMEQAGMIWAYLGSNPDVAAPALTLEPCMTDAEYVTGIHVSVWHANWLLIHDNTADMFHVPFLHGHFAALVRDGKLEFAPAGPGNPGITPESTLNAASQRFTPKRTAKGIYQQAETGAQGEDSRSFDEVEFELPCLVKVWVPFPDGGAPWRFLQYQYPVDENDTIVFAWYGKRVHSDTERDVAKYTAETFATAVADQVYFEDQWICNSQGDIDNARAREHLLSTDNGVAAVRKCIADAYQRQIRKADAASM